MSQPLWGYRPPPEHTEPTGWLWTGEPTTAAELTALRSRLRTTLERTTDSADDQERSDDGAERLLLVFEELASNGLRHGLPPVQVTVIALGSGWLLEVSDGSADSPPEPALARDPATGGLGLYLVARLSVAHGWITQDGRKRVWAQVGGSAMLR